MLLVLLAVLIAVRAGLQRRDHTANSGSGAEPPGLTVHSVAPAQTDLSQAGPAAPSLAMTGEASHSNGLLLVFLPGTGGKPSCCTLFLTRAVSLGYSAIGLTYNNETAVGARCLNDLGCFGEVRANVFDGSDPSSYSDLPASDGVSSRLVALLSYLAARYPREGWGRFLDGGEPAWGSIVMSGHSQGGGEAAFIGTLRRLRGVVALSSPPDTDLSHQPASWLSSVPRGPTPLGRIIAFVHSGDPFYARILADWSAMQLGSLGPPTYVDAAAPPYGGTHQLISSAPLPQAVLATHDSTAVDAATPTCSNGAPEYAPVWDYMLQVAGGLPVPRAAAGCGS